VQDHVEGIAGRDLAAVEAAGLDRCEYFNLNGGIVALHRGYKL